MFLLPETGPHVEHHVGLPLLLPVGEIQQLINNEKLKRHFFFKLSYGVLLCVCMCACCFLSFLCFKLGKI